MKTKFNETKNVRFELEKNISEILVVNDKDLAPFIEVLNFSPENITQKPLGTLLGFFEIKDDNKDSAYIVNFLSSVAKKEYFSNSKRHPIDSFESALHKINVALSEIAKHNNISWVGKLDIALCVITEDEIHFSVTGDARIFLVRDRQMTEISEGLSSSEATINPIKTFIDISSGQVEEKDKIIITSEDIFHVLSEKEIEEGAQSFPNKKFTRFIRTALINELAIAGTIIVDFFKKEIRPVVTKRPRIQRELMQTTEIPNAFSLSAFNRKTSVEKLYDYSEDSPLQKTKDDEYIDTKTGHIYLKDNDELIPKESDWDRFASVMREKYFDFKCWFKDNVTKKVSAEKTTTLFQKTVRKTFSTIKDSKSTKSKKSQKFKNRKKNTDEIDFTDHSREENDTKTKITPDFPKIKKVFFGMNSKQKIYSIVLIAVIILSPLLFKSIINKKKQSAVLITKNEISPPQEKTAEEKLSKEKNIIFETKAEKLYSYSSPTIIDSRMINNELFIITDNKILVIEENELKKEFLLPEEFSRPVLATYMKSLSLFLILTDENQLIGFNSKSKRFQNNPISLPSGSEIKALETYLTYLYVADSAYNQIYKYSRSEGGFGEKTDWLKDDMSLEKMTDIAIDEKVVVSMGNSSPIVLFKGLESDLSFEKSNTSIIWEKIAVTEGMERIYALDKTNSRIVIFDKQGKIEKQLYNKHISDAISFDIDHNDDLRITTPNEVYQITQ